MATKQLNNERSSEEAFKRWCKETNKEITLWIGSQDNKAHRINWDAIAFDNERECYSTYSLKCHSGVKTEKNGGVGLNAIANIFGDIGDAWRSTIAATDRECADRKNQVFRHLDRTIDDKSRWRDTPEPQLCKQYCLQPWCCLWYRLLTERTGGAMTYLKEFYLRKAEYLFVYDYKQKLSYVETANNYSGKQQQFRGLESFARDARRSVTLPRSIENPTHVEVARQGMYVDIIVNKKDHYNIRFKSEGSKIRSNVKTDIYPKKNVQSSHATGYLTKWKHRDSEETKAIMGKIQTRLENEARMQKAVVLNQPVPRIPILTNESKPDIATMAKPRVASFFAGLGGLDQGFCNAGFDVVWANEYNRHVWDTYEANHAATLDRRSIMDIDPDDIPDVDGFIGGPPCQSWSVAGNQKGATDRRGKTLFRFLELVKAKKPRFVVMENVKGILRKKNKANVQRIKRLFAEQGYSLEYRLLNARDYGVPQDRERVIFVAFLDRDVSFDFPTPLDRPVTLETALRDCTANPTAVRRGTSGSVDEYLDSGFSSRFMSRNRVRTWDEQSFTVPAMARQVPIHPSAPRMQKVEKDRFRFREGAQYRRFTVRECAAIQTLPPGFRFRYKNIIEAYRMIGNAVPVRLAEAVARQISTAISTE